MENKRIKGTINRRSSLILPCPAFPPEEAGRATDSHGGASIRQVRTGLTARTFHLCLNWPYNISKIKLRIKIQK